MKKQTGSNGGAKGERLVAITQDYITLGQLLKSVGVIGSGGEVRDYLSDYPVLVNGEPEQRRGRKLRIGDHVAPQREKAIRLVAAEESTSDV